MYMIKDHRPAHVRQEEEPVHITCECGSVVVERGKELIHIGDCDVHVTELVTTLRSKLHGDFACHT